MDEWSWWVQFTMVWSLIGVAHVHRAEGEDVSKRDHDGLLQWIREATTPDMVSLVGRSRMARTIEIAKWFEDRERERDEAEGIVWRAPDGRVLH